MDNWGSILPIATDHRQPNHWCIESEYSTDVGNASVEGFYPLCFGGYTQHSAQDEDIGQEEKQRIQSHGEDDHHEAIDAADPAAGYSCLYEVLMQAEGVGEYINNPILKPLQEEGGWEDQG